jgi:hypothetical protein
MIPLKQKDIYMENRKENTTQVISAAKAGISERTGRRIDHNEHQPQKGKWRNWKTRKDPFSEVWNKSVKPLLEQGVYEATFVLEELQKQYPGKYPDSTLRSLQRKIKQWRAISGKAKGVMFMQEHNPGELGISDFTHPKKIQVTINGDPFEHIFYHFRLPYSGFNYMQVFMGSGESFTALAQGLQEALLYLGGAPKMHRTDSLSASFKNLNKDAKEDVTERYKAFVEHYNMQAARINPGEGHENGAIESSHRHIKNRIEQSLIVRGCADFASFELYREFIGEVTKQHNQQFSKFVEAERGCLQPLPTTKATDYTEIVAVVSCTSTIDVKRVTYSVPSRLIGERLHIRFYNDKLECYLGGTHVITLVRGCKLANKQRSQIIDYRHFIESLVRKPGAFRSSKLRNSILPNEDYRRIWEHVDRNMNSAEASKFIVGVLHLAATHNCESELAITIIDLIDNNQPLKLSVLQNKFNKHKPQLVSVNISQHRLDAYNELIPNYQGTQQ